MRTPPRSTALVLLLALALSAPAAAETYYVDASGDNGNSGLAGSPLRTLQAAVDKCASGDDHIEVGAGSFGGFHVDGKSGIEIFGIGGTVIDSPGTNVEEGVVLEGVTDIRLKGLTIQNLPGAGIRIDGAASQRVTVRNVLLANNGGSGTKSSNLIAVGTVDLRVIRVESRDAGKSGLYLAQTVGSEVLESTMSGNPICGLWINRGSDATVERNVAFGNATTDPAGAGITLSGVTGALVRNNLVYRNAVYGIDVDEDSSANASTGVDLIGNTVYQHDAGDFCLRLRYSHAVRLYDDILIHKGPDSGSLYVIGDPPAESDYNLFSNRFTENVGGANQSLAQWQANHPGLDANSTNAGDSIFANVGANDYHLKNDGVAGVDQGCGVGADVVDLEGSQRPQGGGYDIGAFEFPQVGPDAGLPDPPDAAEPGLDAAEPGLDAAEPGLDAAEPGQDAAEPELDAAQPGPDAAEPELDASEPAADAAEPGLDGGLLDAAVAAHDASQPAADASTSPADASSPDASAVVPDDAGEPHQPVYDLGGCGCSSTGSTAALFALVLLPLASRRRRRA